MRKKEDKKQEEGTLKKGDWKKIREEKSKEQKKEDDALIIEIKEEVQVGDTILEAGDKIEVMKKESENLQEELVMPIIVAINNYLNENQHKDWKEASIGISRSVEDAVTKNPSFSAHAYDMLSQIGRMLK